MFNVYERTMEEDSRFLYQKITALVIAGKYHNTLSVKERIYEEYIKDDFNYIIWRDNDYKETYRMVDRRWRIGDLDRISEGTICMAKALLEKLAVGRDE